MTDSLYIVFDTQLDADSLTSELKTYIRQVNRASNIFASLDLRIARFAVEATKHQENEKSEAQRATQVRDEAIEALEDWLSDYLAVAETGSIVIDTGQELFPDLFTQLQMSISCSELLHKFE